MAMLLLEHTPDGLSLDILIGLPRKRMRQLQRAGMLLPRPLTVRGIIDNGTNVTSVANRITSHFGMRQLRTSTTTTAAGAVSVTLYRVSLGIPDSLGSPPELFHRPAITVMELLAPLPNNVEVLVGRDILDKCLLISDGPRRQHTLSW